MPKRHLPVCTLQVRCLHRQPSCQRRAWSAGSLDAVAYDALWHRKSAREAGEEGCKEGCQEAFEEDCEGETCSSSCSHLCVTLGVTDGW